VTKRITRVFITVIATGLFVAATMTSAAADVETSSRTAQSSSWTLPKISNFVTGFQALTGRTLGDERTQQPSAASGGSPGAAGTSPDESADEPEEPRGPTMEVVDRRSWNAQGGRGKQMGQVNEVVMHHFWRPSLPEVVSQSAETALMRRVERTHLANGWSGIGYNFVIFQSGRIYVGRGWGREGGHTVGRNDKSIGIAFAIDGDKHDPTPEAWEAAKRLIAHGVAGGHLSEDVRISGHSEYAAKSCPGTRIAPRIQELAPQK
jgi:hypothetical protein